MCTRLKMNFQYFTIILLSFVIIGYGQENSTQQHQEEVTKISIFTKINSLLHEEPNPPPIKSRADINTKWIEQKLDHFNVSDTRTWNMRYLTNTEHFKPGGSIFIFLGGEWRITPGYISGGLFYDVAKEVNGYLVYSEHRYYGESQPTENLEIDNLKYLSSEQALADLAHLIITLKTSIPNLENSKVIIAGGSYSASMVTWFRKLYPNLAIAGWASSAPLLAKVDFKEYKNVVGNAIKSAGGNGCWNRIDKAINKLQDMLKNNQTAEFKGALRICDGFESTNSLDVWTVFSIISDVMAGVVQSKFITNIDMTCAKILNNDDDVAGFTEWFFEEIGGTGCYDFTFQDSVNSLRNTDITSNIYRQWYYQTCTEFGWYQTSKSYDHPFGNKFPVSLYIKLCDEVYGIQGDSVYKSVDHTNIKYGGWLPRVTNVFWTHGALDPWNAMGLHVNEDGKNNLIPLYSHCKDFGSVSDEDTAMMREMKKRIREFLIRHGNGTELVHEYTPFCAEPPC